MLSEKTVLPSEKEVILPEGVDKEIVELCKALNRVPGFETIESCVGHGKHPMWIWLKCDTIKHLNHFLWATCWRYGHVGTGDLFNMVVDNADTDKTSEELKLRLESTRILTEDDMTAVEKLADGINRFVDAECTVCLD